MRRCRAVPGNGARGAVACRARPAPDGARRRRPDRGDHPPRRRRRRPARHPRALVERQARAVAGRERRSVAHRHQGRPGGGRAPGGHERRRLVRRRDRPERQVGRQRRRRPARRPGLGHAAAELERRQVEHQRVALDAVPRRRAGRRPRVAGLADVQLRRLELGLHRHARLAARLPRRRAVHEDPPPAPGAARPAPQLGEPVRLLRHRRRRPHRDGHAVARPDDAGCQGPGPALRRAERGLSYS